MLGFQEFSEQGFKMQIIKTSYRGVFCQVSKKLVTISTEANDEDLMDAGLKYEKLERLPNRKVASKTGKAEFAFDALTK